MATVTQSPAPAGLAADAGTDAGGPCGEPGASRDPRASGEPGRRGGAREQDAPAECCTPLARAPLSADEAERLVGVLKAVAVPARLRLLSLVYAHEGAEACVCELTGPLGLTQPTVSHHLKVLVDAGLLTRSKRGVWAYYRAVPDALAALAAALAPPERPNPSV
jgi:ArsR family transcriptional regulator